MTVLALQRGIPAAIGRYLAENSFPQGCARHSAIWRTDIWGTTHNASTRFAFLSVGERIERMEGGRSNRLPEPWLSVCQASVLWFARTHSLSGGRIAAILSAMRGFIQFVTNGTPTCSAIEMLHTRHFLDYELHLKNRVKSGSLTQGGARQIAMGVAQFGAFVNHFSLTKRIEYTPTFKRPTSTHEYKVTDATGANTNLHRSKLLDKDIMFALGNAFHAETRASDKFMLASILVLAITGFRITELLSLEADCFREYEPEPGKKRYEILYRAEKGGPSLPRQVTESAVCYVKECLDTILKFTAPGRRIAERLHRENTIVPLKHPLRNRPSCHRAEIADFLGVHGGTVDSIIRRHGILAGSRDARGRVSYPTADLIQVLNDYYLTPKDARTVGYHPVLRRMDDGTTVLLKDALFVTRAFELGAGARTLSFIPSPVSPPIFRKWLLAFCEKSQLKNSDGTLVRINSHQFRHFIDTMFVLGGMTEEEIARIFGRKHIKDNRAYNHLTPRERRQQVEKSIRAGQAVGVIQDTYNKMKLLAPEHADEFLRSSIEAVHVTEYGACVLDFARQPCPHHLNCVSGKDGKACRHLVIKPGNVVSLEAVQKQLRIAVAQRAKIKGSGTYVKDWANQTDVQIKNLLAIESAHLQVETAPGAAVFPFPEGANPQAIIEAKDRAEFQKEAGK